MENDKVSNKLIDQAFKIFVNQTNVSVVFLKQWGCLINARISDFTRNLTKIAVIILRMILNRKIEINRRGTNMIMFYGDLHKITVNLCLT